MCQPKENHLSNENDDENDTGTRQPIARQSLHQGLEPGHGPIGIGEEEAPPTESPSGGATAVVSGAKGASGTEEKWINDDDPQRWNYGNSTLVPQSPGGSARSSWPRRVRRFAQRNLFLVGSLLATIASSKDLHDALADAAGDEDYDDDDDEEETNPFEYWDVYKVLMVLSTLLYLLDSALHIRLLRRDDTSKDGDESKEPPRIVADRTPEETRVEGGDDRFGWSNKSGDSDDHTRDDESEDEEDEEDIDEFDSLGFAVIFGVAAVFDLSCSLTDDEYYPWPSYILELLSVYLFLASALLTLFSKRHYYLEYFASKKKGAGYFALWEDAAAADREASLEKKGLETHSASGALIDGSGKNSLGEHHEEDAPDDVWEEYDKQERLLICLGDGFFLLGCTVDVVLSLYDNPLHEASWLHTASGGLFSSFCWFVDAVLYRMADADVLNQTRTTTRAPDAEPPNDLVSSFSRIPS